MADAVLSMKNRNTTTSVHKIKTPFRVDPTDNRVIFTGDESGNRFVHIDVWEKKKVKKQTVVLMTKRAKRSQAGPESSSNQYSTLVN